MRKYIFLTFLISITAGCNNLEDAELSERQTFIKFFNAPHNFTAAGMEIIPGGYVLLGNMVVNDTLTIAALIETDNNGNRVGAIHYFSNEGITGKAFKPIFNGGSLNGYVVVGDSIKVNPFEEQAANIEIASVKLLQLDPNFEVVKQYVRTDKRPISPSHPIKIDYVGHALTITDDGRVFVLGGVKEGVVAQQASPELTQLVEFDNSLDSTWSIEYDINDKTYQNSRSLIYNNGLITWASAIALPQGTFNQSYVSVPVAEEQSIFVNFSQIGQTSNQLFVPGDICQANNPVFGFGVVGTYSIETNGSLGNLFFLRVNSNGDIQPNSIRFFDGRSGTDNLNDPDQSNVLDGGETVTSTYDGGFVVAGTTTLSSENGKDIWLIKINSAGDAVWSKTFGGSGNQIPVSIRALPSGELLICGTNTVGGFSSIFLIKTDGNGEIKK